MARAELGEKLGILPLAAARRSPSAPSWRIGALVILLLAVVRWLAVAGIPREWGLLIVGVAVVGVAFALDQAVAAPIA